LWSADGKQADPNGWTTSVLIVIVVCSGLALAETNVTDNTPIERDSDRPLLAGQYRKWRLET
jgi:hypothetical protein